MAVNCDGANWGRESTLCSLGLLLSFCCLLLLHRVLLFTLVLVLLATFVAHFGFPSLEVVVQVSPQSVIVATSLEDVQFIPSPLALISKNGTWLEMPRARTDVSDWRLDFAIVT